jgi:hypothetical protein
MSNDSNHDHHWQQWRRSALLLTMAIGVLTSSQANGRRLQSSLTGAALDPWGAFVSGVSVSLGNQTAAQLSLPIPTKSKIRFSTAAARQI